MSSDVHDFAFRYRGIASFGLLSLGIVLGKALHSVIPIYFQAIPAVLLGAVFSLCFLFVFGFVDASLEFDLREGMHDFKNNLLSFVFASLILGFCCTQKSIPVRWADIVKSVFHEGMPMLVYSQILIWGQSCAAIMTCYILKVTTIDSISSPFLGGLIPLGLEAGRSDIDPSIITKTDWADGVVRLTEEIGLVMSVCIGILMIAAKSWSLKMSAAPSSSQEYFERRVQSPVKQRLSSQPTELEMPLMRSSSHVDDDNVVDQDQSSLSIILPIERPICQPLTTSDRSSPLGTHVAIIGISVFIACLIDILLKLIEEKSSSLSSHQLLSGVRLFKLSMVVAMILMISIKKSYPHVLFKSDLFLKISGVLLDVLVISSFVEVSFRPLSSASDPINKLTYAIAFIACVVWNAFMIVVVAPHFYPNFWFERSVTLMGDALGHSWVGLLLIRAMDSNLQTPVPLAFCYKLMIFFIPGSKNTIVLTLIDSYGPLGAFFICLLVVVTWYIIFDRFFKPRFVDAVKSDVDKSLSSFLTNIFSRIGWHRYRSVSTDSDDGKDSKDSSNIGEVAMKHLSPQSVLPSSAGIPIATNPILHQSSTIVSDIKLRELMRLVLPERILLRAACLKYCLKRDGATLSQLYYCVGMKDSHDAFTSSRAVKSDCCLILIEDSWGYVFGGFVSCQLQRSARYYGTGECCVFQLLPQLSIYRSTDKNDYFVLTTDSNIAMGGGHGFSWQVDDEMEIGVSNESDTYGNKNCLASSEFFKCLNVEVWTFENPSFP